MKKLDKLIRGGVIENMLISPKQTHYIVHLLDRPVAYRDFVSLTPNVRATTGVYWLKYVPESVRAIKHQKEQYVLACDMLAFHMKLYNPKHFERLSQKIPELAWMIRNTNYDPQLFALAKQHPGMPITFCLNVVSYCDMIEQKAESEGIDIDHKPLVAYRCSEKNYNEIFAPEGKKCYVATEKDYRKVLDEENYEYTERAE